MSFNVNTVPPYYRSQMFDKILHTLFRFSDFVRIEFLSTTNISGLRAVK
jgi:hypothetical protein